MSVRMAQGAQQIKKMRNVHMKKNNNALFYCTTNEIEYGNLNTTNWGPLFESMCIWQEQSTFLLASDAFPKFLDHMSSVDMITKLRQRESAGEQLPCRTAAYGTYIHMFL